MSTNEEKIEFPGDPMCLYAALSYSVDQVVKAREHGIGPEGTYNDLCPELGILPSKEYRTQVSSHGFRDYSTPIRNTDQTIFDPRVWNDKVREFFIEKILLAVRPKVVLISTVSPGFRYAIDIALTVKNNLPDAIVVIGGRHIDETISYSWDTSEVQNAYSGVLSCIDDGRIESVFDFGIAGDGYFALDALLKAISISLHIDSKSLQSKLAIFDNLDNLALTMPEIPGEALIFGIADDEKLFHIWPVNGPKYELSDLPSPYKAFAIRAEFPIFTKTSGLIRRTAHMMVTNSCPYHCNFCSEGSIVSGPMIRFEVDAVEKAIKRIVEYVGYGAEAVFFDDSVFWGGNLRRMKEFSQRLISLKLGISGGYIPPNYGSHDKVRLLDLQWGAQLTVDLLVTVMGEDKALELLETMKQAGCTYVYLGIESMSTSVIRHIHKNLDAETPWKDRVRAALTIIKKAKIRVGSSVLFGLEGETPETIEETIAEIEMLIRDDLLYVASPNILTYHPGTAITRMHSMEDRIDYHSPQTENKPPYSYFEEAFPSVVSIRLTESDIWHIHDQTLRRWGRIRNSNSMSPLPI
jgi:radical SAM superfamily enzyme YgiQ (UPF0313 family)